MLRHATTQSRIIANSAARGPRVTRLHNSTVVKSIKSTRPPPSQGQAKQGKQQDGSGSKKGSSTFNTIAKTIFLFSSGAALGGSYTAYVDSQSNSTFPNSSTTPLSDLSPPAYGNKEAFEKAYSEITALLGKENVNKTKDVLDAHSDTYWNSHHAKPDERPGIVAFPGSTEDVAKIAKISHKYRVPIVPFAGGTSLEGHFTPIYGGISLDFSRMNQILALHKEDLDIVVQPAVNWEELNEYLADHDLFFGPDPGPGAQISGMIGTGCSGTNAYRYGTMRENTLSLTVVLADGTVIKTKQRPRKSSAGYNLTQLFIGSEGTLGIVTEATLKLVPKPANESIAIATFNSLEDAAGAAAEVVQNGILVGAVELLDHRMMKAINDSGATTRRWDEAPTLLFKFAGPTPANVNDMISHVKSISKGHENRSFEFATKEEDREELWSARKNALWSTIDVGPKGCHTWTTDVAVPMSRLADIIRVTQKDIVDSGLFGTIVGHVGDGNFHSILIYDPEKERSIVEGVVHRMVKRAIEFEGTCTGEHGVGVGKKLYLDEEIGPDAVNLMRRVKLALDPHLLLNPDKIITVNPNSKEP
ncbi:hypothetical protein DV451_004547 [Geotrichum candidum]|uniref:D-lactate dehydrogenase (cytochrome) n=1 Tax=Geotrichum candidum TaxID=1173061 RepID=A0A9P5KPI1_GEOCN|nr:hypothetical protein DV451_004547 [Geotrichum candidum]KAF5105421.1 hypothetical protein DV453_004843 [Geotrichum candidum]